MNIVFTLSKDSSRGRIEIESEMAEKLATALMDVLTYVNAKLNEEFKEKNTKRREK